MFLATTALTEFWNTSEEILFLGPWCLRYDRREDWEGLKYKVIQNPWTDQYRIRQAEVYCNDVIEHILSELIPLLNQVHGVGYSARYWRILLGGWLLHYVHALYDRYVSLKRALESRSGLRTIALSPFDYRTPVDSLEFMRFAYVESPDLFNLQLYSQVLKALGFNAAVWKEVGHDSEGRNAGATQGSGVAAGRPLKNLARKVAAQILVAMARVIQPRVMLGGLGLNRRNLFRLVRAMAFHGWALPSPQVVRYDGRRRDGAMRKGLGDIPSRDEFTSVLIQTLPTNLPLVFLEGYADFREGCLKMWPCPPKVLVSSADWYFNEPFKFLAAELGECGSRLVGGQHGGGYGTSKVSPQEKYECSIADRWLTFGWGDGQGNGTVRPLPHPKFLPLRTRYGRRGEIPKDILLVTTSHPRYSFRFESYPIGQFDTVLEWRSRFIQALSAAYRAHLIVRLSGEDFGWCHVQRLVDTCGPLRFSDGRGFLRQLLGQVRLVVVEYHGTACLETLAANVPTILFWDPQGWEVRDEAAPYFASLRKVGILWDSPEGAAAKVTEVYDDPLMWWRSEAVQEVRRAFVTRYALAREDWVVCWVKALEEEIALSQVGEK